MLEIKKSKDQNHGIEKTAEGLTTSGNFILGCSHKKGDTYDNPILICSKIRQTNQYVTPSWMSCLERAKTVLSAPADR
jgi:hypothetical protein